MSFVIFWGYRPFLLVTVTSQLCLAEAFHEVPVPFVVFLRVFYVTPLVIYKSVKILSMWGKYTKRVMPSILLCISTFKTDTTYLFLDGEDNFSCICTALPGVLV